jgi:hypothetical protein
MDAATGACLHLTISAPVCCSVDGGVERRPPDQTVRTTPRLVSSSALWLETFVGRRMRIASLRRERARGFGTTT